MSEFLLGVVVGVIAVLAGFILTIIWDTYKYRRDTRSKEETILKAVEVEIDYNIEALIFNKNLLEKELEIIDKKRMVADPLVSLQSGFWDLLKVHLPQKTTKLGPLIKIRNVAQGTNQVNEVIRSRENYRISNQAMTNFHVHLKSYDILLMNQIRILQKSLLEILPLIRNK